jgi:hypothetical protein
MSSSVPGQGKVQHDLSTSSIGGDADTENSADVADSKDDLVLDGGDLLDANPLGDVGNGLGEQFVSLSTESDRAKLSYRTSFTRGPLYESRSKSNLFSSTTPSSSRQTSPPSQYLNLRARTLRGKASHNVSDTSLGSRSSTPRGPTSETKGGGQLDWYVEGPGRRVGYDDLTAIDWIFEYTKERQRLRLLSSSTHGLVGYLRQLLDASHVWLVLILTGITVGILAAAINIASDWLGDIKFGFCKQGEQGGQFYLNKGFCCWGHDGSPLSLVSKQEIRLMCFRAFPVPGLDALATSSPYPIHRWRIRGRVYLLHIVFCTTDISCLRSLLINHSRSSLLPALQY